MDEKQPISRRQLLRGGFLRKVVEAATEPVAAAAEAMEGAMGAMEGSVRPARAPIALPMHRPPGAIDEASFMSGCTRCGDCIEACPVDAIVLAPARFRQAAGTPMIDPYNSPCVMCEGTPCIAACEPGVLGSGDLKMAKASILGHACLAYQGSFCTVCSERCPVAGAIEDEGGRPRIVEEVCTGCGVCQYVCPAPSNAVLLMPLMERGGMKNGGGQGTANLPEGDGA